MKMIEFCLNVSQDLMYIISPVYTLSYTLQINFQESHKIQEVSTDAHQCSHMLNFKLYVVSV